MANMVKMSNKCNVKIHRVSNIEKYRNTSSIDRYLIHVLALYIIYKT